VSDERPENPESNSNQNPPEASPATPTPPPAPNAPVTEPASASVAPTAPPKPTPKQTPTPKPSVSAEEKEEKAVEPEIPELVQAVCRTIPHTQPYSGSSDTPAIETRPEHLVEVLTALRDNPEFAFSMLMDHTAIDRLVDNSVDNKNDADNSVADNSVENSVDENSVDKNSVADSSVADSEFELLYRLYSLKTLAMLVVFTTIPRETPVIPTVSSVWRIAEWQEREVYDLFGILYDNHPDLRRVFLEDAWEGFPLRKDYQDDFMLTLVRE